MSSEFTASRTCFCVKERHKLRKIVITGGPGAGKSAILNLAKMEFCPHVALLPEAATILFSGGFWRDDSSHGRIVAQRAIFYVQKEMERFITMQKKFSLAFAIGELLTDSHTGQRGQNLFSKVEISRDKELSTMLP
ncbi:hypothetical protein EBQ74_02445 [bacterium]|nr:hypothetical protein [bacterium]